jgi:mannosylglycoprotein endo-beta-mannosidase
MYESRNATMFKNTTGVITWMNHPAQPSFVWQLYHYDLEPHSSLYAVKKAAEIVHVQLNESNGGIEVVNNHAAALKSLRVHAMIYGFDGKVADEKTYAVESVAASTTVKVAQLEVPARTSAVYFVRLDLLDETGVQLSTNFYWQNVTQDDFANLDQLPLAKLDVSATARTEAANTILSVSLHNPTETISLMAHLQLHRKTSGERVLPVFYSDNYISLAPGETRTVSIQAGTADLKGEAPLVTLDGFNIDVTPAEAPVAVGLNLNAQPMHCRVLI